MGQVITIVARFKAKAGLEQKLKEELIALIAPTRAEEACINYNLHQAMEDKSVFVFYENWRDRPGFDKHAASAHLKAFRAKADELLAEPGDVVLLEPIA